MKIRAALAILATLSLLRCGRTSEPPPAPVKRARLKTSLAIPATDQRAALRDAYRLGPDRRFLLAFEEIRRLAGTPASPAPPARAVFAADRWTLRLDDKEVGTLPELPDFPDYLALLVDYARTSGPKPSVSPAKSRSGSDRFLMPGIVADLQSAEAPEAAGISIPDGARAFTRIVFQMQDRLELAPLVPARALALLAITRAQDAQAAFEEEVLLAHALGYTAHAETAGRALPSGSAVRLFETCEDHALWNLASKPGAPEETRYLALRRTLGEGSLPRWKEARARFFPGDASLSILATGFDLPLPQQMELGDTKEILTGLVPLAATREISLGNLPDGAVPTDAFEAKLAADGASLHGLLWDGAVRTQYYQAEAYSAADPAFRPDTQVTYPASLMRLLNLDRDPRKTPPREGDGRAVPMWIDWTADDLRSVTAADPTVTRELRSLVKRLDARPVHRACLARFSHRNLFDPRAAGDLYGSLLKVLGDGSRTLKSESAFYAGDWPTIERLLTSRDLKGPEASTILRDWFNARAEPALLDREYQKAIDRFPSEWNLPSGWVDVLRSRREFARANEVLERWMRRNTDPRTPGFFHSRIRLAHGYALAHEYAKGRALLEHFPVGDIAQESYRERVLAENLAGQDHLKEAEAMVRDAIQKYPEDADKYRVLVGILWAESQHRQAAELLGQLAQGAAPASICEILSQDFPAILVNRDPTRLGDALDDLARQGALAPHYGCAASGFADAGRWDDAVLVSTKLAPPGSDRWDQTLTLYHYMVSASGRDVALAWLRKQPAINPPLQFGVKALYRKDDDLLWDAVSPDARSRPEMVWLIRACAYAMRSAENAPHRDELLAYYGRPESAAWLEGRYLVGLATEAELLAATDTPRRLSGTAFYLGAKAQGEGRMRDACDWYRVSMETPGEPIPQGLAIWALSDWIRTPQGLQKLEKPAAPGSGAARPKAI